MCVCVRVRACTHAQAHACVCMQKRVIQRLALCNAVRLSPFVMFCVLRFKPHTHIMEHCSALDMHYMYSFSLSLR